jgi:hypothetical protein
MSRNILFVRAVIYERPVEVAKPKWLSQMSAAPAPMGVGKDIRIKKRRTRTKFEPITKN